MMSEFNYQNNLQTKDVNTASKKTQKDYPPELDLEAMLAKSLLGGLFLTIGFLLVMY